MISTDREDQYTKNQSLNEKPNPPAMLGRME